MFTVKLSGHSVRAVVECLTPEEAWFSSGSDALSSSHFKVGRGLMTTKDVIQRGDAVLHEAGDV